jgi:hypothetical protein
LAKGCSTAKKAKFPEDAVALQAKVKIAGKMNPQDIVFIVANGRVTDEIPFFEFRAPSKSK